MYLVISLLVLRAGYGICCIKLPNGDSFVIFFFFFFFFFFFYEHDLDVSEFKVKFIPVFFFFCDYKDQKTIW